MAKSPKNDNQRAPPQSRHKNPWLIAVEDAGKAFLFLVDRFGWHGAILILGYIFVERHGTEEQKQRIIETFILGQGFSTAWQVTVPVLLFAGLTIAQHHYWKKRVKILNDEKDRLSQWKSDHQAKEIPINLHSTDVKGKS